MFLVSWAFSWFLTPVIYIRHLRLAKFFLAGFYLCFIFHPFTFYLFGRIFCECSGLFLSYFALEVRASEEGVGISSVEQGEINEKIFEKRFKSYHKFLTTVDYRHYVSSLSDQNTEILFLALHNNNSLSDVWFGRCKFFASPSDYPES